MHQLDKKWYHKVLLYNLFANGGGGDSTRCSKISAQNLTL